MASYQRREKLSSRKWRKGLLGLIVAAGLGSGLYWAYWFTLGDRFTAICSVHQVYHSAAPSPAALARIVENREIRSVVDLRSSPRGFMPSDESRLLATLGVRYFHLPTPQVPKLETVDQFLELGIDSDNFPMLIHCHHGEGRSVLFAALHRIEFDSWPVEQARKATKLLSFRGSFGPNGAKGKFIRSYEPRLKKTAAGSRFPAFFGIPETRLHLAPSQS